jgi:hypothetical protein
MCNRAPEGWGAYSDPVYGFRLHVPDSYVVRRQDVARCSRSATPALTLSRTSSRACRGGKSVCQSTLIAPCCSRYVLRGERAYLLTAMSAEGEATAETVRLVP